MRKTKPWQFIFFNQIESIKSFFLVVALAILMQAVLADNAQGTSKSSAPMSANLKAILRVFPEGNWCVDPSLGYLGRVSYEDRTGSKPPRVYWISREGSIKFVNTATIGRIDVNFFLDLVYRDNNDEISYRLEGLRSIVNFFELSNNKIYGLITMLSSLRTEIGLCCAILILPAQQYTLNTIDCRETNWFFGFTTGREL
jgi:hypothetical protein